MGLGDLWNLIVFEPMLNVLILLSNFMFHNFGLTIIAFTIVVRFLMYPLTLKQLRASKAMAELQPKIKELQKKYGKDQQKMSQETMKLYKEAGVSPMGCVVPMLVQLPIWIALYQAIMGALAVTPDSLFGLSKHLYSWPLVHQAVPLGEKFLWFNLALPDRLVILPILVAGSMWVQQKMTVVSTADPKQASMNRTMLLMMPLMFGFFTLQFPSGLAIYWVTSNIVGIIMQYFVTGWGGLFKGKQAQGASAPPPSSSPGKRERKPADGKPGGQRQNS